MSLGNKQIMAENLQYYMNKSNIDRNRLCDDLGFKYTTVRDWCKGITYPRIDKIEMMANYFGISKADLVEKRKKEAPEFIPGTVELIDLFSRATPEQRQAVLNLLRSFVSDQE